MNILVKWPTRGCAAGLSDRIADWKQRQSGWHDVRYLFTPDADDTATVDALHDLQAFSIVAPERGKIAACNHGLACPLENFPDWEGPWKWDLLVLASDDMRPEVWGWDDVVARAMAWHFPALDGLLHFPDGFTAHEKFVTLPIMGANFWRRFGYVYQPEYASLCCDLEQTEVSRTLSKLAYIDLPIFQHRWRGTLPGAKEDRTLTCNEALHARDKITYIRRKTASFGLARPVLSILIPTMDCRRQTATVLFAELYRQIWAMGDGHWQVEIHTLLDEKRYTVGEKRKMLLSRARGEYVAFVDDDDRVAPDYIESILAAIKSSPRVDCVVFQGEFRQDGGAPAIFDFDLKYRFYRNTPGIMERTPNHLCPVREDLARRIGFGSQNYGEDTDYARRLRPMLRTQAVCRDADGRKKTLYFYDFSPANSQTQGAGRRPEVAR